MAQVVTVRYMSDADIDDCERVWREAGQQLVGSALSASPKRISRHARQVRHLLRSDPAGSWVAEAEGQAIGFGQAFVRESLWVLAHLFVAPKWQGQGIGRELLDRTLAYGDRDGPGLIMSSLDPKAMRRYALAGFAPRPALRAHGHVDRRRLQASPSVEEKTIDELSCTAAIDRRVRGAAREQDLALLMSEGDRLVVVEDRGYAVVHESGTPLVLAALDDDAATQLLTTALAEASPDHEVEVKRMTAEQQWAIDIVLAARLELTPHGPAMVRRDPGPLAPYLPNGALG